MNGLIEFVKTLGAARLAAMGAVTALLIGFFALVIMRISTPAMAPLFTELSLDDSAKIAKELDAQGIPFELRADGATILVPKPDVTRLRMKLAEVSAVHAGRPDDAIAAYKELIEANPEDEAAVAGLDRLLRSSPSHRDDLRWLLRLRVKRAEGRAAVPLLAEWAMLEEEAFGESARAVELHRELLGVDPEHVASLRALSRLLVVAENYPQLKSDANFRDLQAQLEGTENRITVARKRYIDSVQNYNVLVRQFPVNLTAMVFGYDAKPQFTVENEAEISRPPTVDFQRPDGAKSTTNSRVLSSRLRQSREGPAPDPLH